MSFSLAQRLGAVASIFLAVGTALLGCQGQTNVRIGADLKNGTGEVGFSHDSGGNQLMTITNGADAPMDFKYVNAEGQTMHTTTGVASGATVTCPPGATNVVVTCPSTPPPSGGGGGGGGGIFEVTTGSDHLPARALRRIEYDVMVLTLKPDLANNTAVGNLTANFTVRGPEGLASDDLWARVRDVVLNGPGTLVPRGVTVNYFVKMTPTLGGANLVAADVGHFTHLRLNWNGQTDYAVLGESNNVSLGTWDNGWQVATTFIDISDFDITGTDNRGDLQIVNDSDNEVYPFSQFVQYY